MSFNCGQILPWVGATRNSIIRNRPNRGLSLDLSSKVIAVSPAAKTRLPGNSSRRHSIRHLGNSLAGLEVAVVQAQGKEFLEAGIDLVMHGSILRRDSGQILEKTLTALVVVALRAL